MGGWFVLPYEESCVQPNLGRKKATVLWKWCLMWLYYMLFAHHFSHLILLTALWAAGIIIPSFLMGKLRLWAVRGFPGLAGDQSPQLSQGTPPSGNQDILPELCVSDASLYPSLPLCSTFLFHLNVFLIFSRAEVTLCVSSSLFLFLSVLARKSRNSKKRQLSLLVPLYSAPWIIYLDSRGWRLKNILDLAVTRWILCSELECSGKEKCAFEIREDFERPENTGGSAGARRTATRRSIFIAHKGHPRGSHVQILYSLQLGFENN